MAVRSRRSIRVDAFPFTTERGSRMTTPKRTSLADLPTFTLRSIEGEKQHRSTLATKVVAALSTIRGQWSAGKIAGVILTNERRDVVAAVLNELVAEGKLV